MDIVGTSGADNLSGTNLDDNIYGLDGSDHIWGYNGTDYIYGHVGNDWLYGGVGIDYLYGGDDHDYLDGGTEADHMRGQAGNDTYIVENVGDRVYETWGNGYDTIRSYLTNYTIAGDAHVEVLELSGPTALNGNGNGYDNRILGNSNGNTLRGRDGNDNLYGLNGVDTLDGGTGNDYLDGGYGADTLIGGLHNDTYVVDDTDDHIYEFFNEGTDSVQSYITYSLEGTYLENLTLLGSAVIDGTGNDQGNFINGNWAANVLHGGGGVDRIDGKGGADTMYGGLDGDFYYVDHTGDATIDVDSGDVDVVYASASHTIGAYIERLELMDSASAVNGGGNNQDNSIYGNALGNTLSGFDGVDRIEGRGGIDYLWGGGARDVLYGGAEGDFLYGEAGTDELRGEAGNDTMTGGADNDSYHVGDAGDVVVELAGGGDDDFVYSTVSISADHVEHFYMLEEGGAINATGRGDDNMMLVGNSFANRLEGGSFDDYFNGGGGADTMIGRGGDDRYIIDNMGDEVMEGGGEGEDTVETTIDHVLDDNVERLWMIDSGGAIDGTGNSRDNDMHGNIHDNVLDGRGGVDYMAGGGGNDTYYVDNTADEVFENLPTDGIDQVLASASFTLGLRVENLAFLEGFGPLDAIGSLYANVLAGNSSNNVLRGEDGDDTLVGNLGNDTLIGGFNMDTLRGGGDADTFRFLGSWESSVAAPDQILDFSTAENDRIDLSAIDAINGGTDDRFEFIGAADFTYGVAGQLRYAGGFLEGNADIFGEADFRIEVGVASLAVGDFLL